MHVGDDSPLGLEAVDPGKRIVDAEMARMRRVTQTIDDPEIEIFKRTPAFPGNVAEVGRISRIADAIAERRNVAVLQHERGQFHRTAPPNDLLALAVFDA